MSEKVPYDTSVGFAETRAHKFFIYCDAPVTVLGNANSFLNRCVDLKQCDPCFAPLVFKLRDSRVTVFCGIP